MSPTAPRGSDTIGLDDRRAAAASGTRIRPFGRIVAGGVRRYPDRVSHDAIGFGDALPMPSLGVPSQTRRRTASRHGAAFFSGSARGVIHGRSVTRNAGGSHEVGRATFSTVKCWPAGEGIQIAEPDDPAGRQLHRFSHFHFPNCSRRPSLPGTGLRDCRSVCAPLVDQEESKSDAR